MQDTGDKDGRNEQLLSKRAFVLVFLHNEHKYTQLSLLWFMNRT